MYNVCVVCAGAEIQVDQIIGDEVRRAVGCFQLLRRETTHAWLWRAWLCTSGPYTWLDLHRTNSHQLLPLNSCL